MPYSSLPSQYNNPLLELKIIAPGTSLSVYVAPNGNDANTGVSVAQSVRTFKRAWDIAQNYVITGNGELYITFAGGTYAYSDADVPDNLYHPQGSNIIIQGDPNAVKQRYLYRVQNYSWDISRISYHGHTGTVNLTNLQAGHTHGYTASDTNGWVAISNPAISSAGTPIYSYWDATTGVSYAGLDDGSVPGRNGIYGDMFFNHGFSYENANGILGLAQIGNSSQSDTDLQLIFKNTNTDPRIPEFAPYIRGAVSNGIGNALTYGGIANNYPENQYSKPNGYYGQAWSGYPSRVVTDNYITNQPHLVTSFPATIIKSGAKPVFTVANGNIKAIRNFAVIANDFATPNANAAKTRAFNALYPGEEHSPEPVGSSAPLQALLVAQNAKVGIRHLGVFHAEFGVLATNSEIYTYTESDKDSANTTISGVRTAGGTDITARLGHPDNTPVLNLMNVRYGIHAHGSKIGIGYESNRQHSVCKHYYTEQGCFIQSAYRGIHATNDSSVSVRSAVINSSRSIPRFSFVLRLPVFAGGTLSSGNTYSFLSPPSWGGSEFSANSNQAFQNGYTAAAVVMRCVHPQFGTSVVGVTLGYITNISGGGTFPYTTGQYSTTHSLGSSPVPVYWQTLNVYGYRVGDAAGLSFSYANDFTNALQTVTGYTLEFIAFSDNEITRSGGTYEIGNKSFRLSAASGQFVTGTTSSTASLFPIQEYRSNDFFTSASGDATVGVYNGSTLIVRKNIFIHSAESSGVEVVGGSRLLCGRDRAGNSFVGGDSGVVDESGTLLMNGCGYYGLSVRQSYANLGGLYLKNWKPVFKNLSSSAAADCPIQSIITNQSTIDFADPSATVATVFHPHSTGGLWGTIVGPVCVNTNANAALIWASNTSNVQVEASATNSAFTNFISAYDGGTPETRVTRGNLSFLTIRGGSVLSSVPIGSTTASGDVATQYGHIWNDNNTNTQIMSRTLTGFRYNQSTTSPFYRWWLVSGTRPGGGGRTAGVWSSSGESVKKVGWVIPVNFSWLTGIAQPIVSCGAGLSGTSAVGLTYAGTVAANNASASTIAGSSWASATSNDTTSRWLNLG